jgi:hypothetical protein
MTFRPVQSLLCFSGERDEALRAVWKCWRCCFYRRVNVFRHGCFEPFRRPSKACIYGLSPGKTACPDFTRNRSMHTGRSHTNIANFVYRCVFQNTERTVEGLCTGTSPEHNGLLWEAACWRRRPYKHTAFDVLASKLPPTVLPTAAAHSTPAFRRTRQGNGAESRHTGSAR